jgi:DNA primase
VSISADTIEDVKQAVQIEEVVGDFVNLKKKGHYFLGCCPFHNEKTPSFTVTPNKGIYKCFGCGKAGDSIQFVMDIEGLTYIESIRFLAGKYGIEIKDDQLAPADAILQTEKESLMIVLNFASKFYENTLWETEDGKSIGLSYYKERGFSQNTIKKFNLGFSLETWDGLTKKALEEGYSKEFLIKAGLSIQNEEKENRLYDRFRGRVIFPIHNLTGKVIAFGARILKTDKKQPKYLNSPETEVYHKSKVLYGLFQAKNSIRNEDNCYLVEGYTDVISLHQGGIENVVASSGTSLTEDQIKLIKRYSENITVLYDGDAAGLKASLRGIDMILAEGMNVKVVVFPDGEDPDSFIKKVGGDGFKEHIRKSATDFITFKTTLALSEAGNDPLKRAEVIKEIVESISKIPDSIKRAVFFRQCSQMLEIDETVLITEFNKNQLKTRQKKKEQEEDPMLPPPDFFAEAIQEEIQKPDASFNAMSAQEKEIIRLLLKYGNEQIETTNFAAYILSEIEDTQFNDPILQRILQEIRDDVYSLGVLREQKLLSHQEESIRNLCIGLVTDRHFYSENWEKHEIFIPKDTDILPTIGYLTLLRLKFRSIGFMIKENMLELRKAEQAKDDIIPFLQVHKQLKETEGELSKMLGITISGRITPV